MKLVISRPELKRAYADLMIESSTVAEQFLTMLKGMEKEYCEITVRETTLNRDELVLKVNYYLGEKPEDEFRIEGLTLKQFFDILEQ